MKGTGGEGRSSLPSICALSVTPKCSPAWCEGGSLKSPVALLKSPSVALDCLVARAFQPSNRLSESHTQAIRLCLSVPSPQAKVCVPSQCKADGQKPQTKSASEGRILHSSPQQRFWSDFSFLFSWRLCSASLLFKVVALQQVLKRMIFRNCEEAEEAGRVSPL